MKGKASAETQQGSISRAGRSLPELCCHRNKKQHAIADISNIKWVQHCQAQGGFIVQPPAVSFTVCEQPVNRLGK